MSVGVLTVDDQPYFLSAAEEVIEATPGFRSAGQASSGREALALLRRGCDAQLALVDVRMPEMGGVDCARLMKELQPDLTVVLISVDPRPDVPLPDEGGGFVFVPKQEFGPGKLRSLWSTYGH